MEVGRNLRGGKDRISSLPDCLLHLIMSFLTTHRAVQTCVLSKRWKNLWTTLPFLNFDMWAFEDDIVFSNSESEDGEERFRRFTDFLNMTLLHREASDLHTFRLSCADIPDHLHNMFKRSWIRYVIKHNPRVIDIDIALEDSPPLDVFSCASLLNLSLSIGYTYIPRFDQYQNNIVVVNLPLLRQMHLQSIFLSQNLMEKIFCGCPMLEVLHLQRCNLDFSSIRSQSLKHLKLEYYCSFDRTKKLELIVTPNLLSFNYYKCVNYVGHKMLMNMPSLTTASMYLDDCSCGPYNGKSNIFMGISSVQSLKLYGSLIKDILKNELPTCPEFRNMKDLFVDISLCLICHFNLLASFLDHNPNLKKLSFYHYHFGCSRKDILKNELLTCPDFQNVDDLTAYVLCLNCYFNALASFLDHFPNLKKLSLKSGPRNEYSCKCQEEEDRNQESLKIAPFRCKQLETVDVSFSRHDKHFHWVVKYLQDATEGLQARIKMIGR